MRSRLQNTSPQGHVIYTFYPVLRRLKVRCHVFINEVHERWFPSFHFHPDLLTKLKKLKLAQPVLNTLIFYVLATNNQRSLSYKLLVLGHICRKFNLKSSYEAITFLKQFYTFQIKSYN